MTTAKRRRAALRKILKAGVSGTQSELGELLTTQGHPATQSTISRDLKVLGAQRRLRDDGEFVYVLRGTGATEFPADMILSIDQNEQLVVVRTRIGRAQAVGIELDALRHPDILGTIAGDDTVLVIPRSIQNTSQLADKLGEMANL